MTKELNRALGRRAIGSNGPTVSLMGVGGGTLSAGAGEDAQRAMLEEAWRRGLRYFDTAPLYSAGDSERRIGALLRRHGQGEYTLSSKVGRYPSGSAARKFDYSADTTRRSLDESMTRLGGAHIGIVLIHDVDAEMHDDGFGDAFAQATEECFPVLAEAREAGVIDAIGLSSRQADVCARAIETIDIDCVMMAGSYSLLNHEPLDTLFPLCDTRGVSVLLASPFNSGILATGRPESTYAYQTAPSDTIERVSRINAICERHDVPIATAALQFASFPNVVRSVVVGSKDAAELNRNLHAFDYNVPADLWSELIDAGLIPETAPIRPSSSSYAPRT